MSCDRACDELCFICLTDTINPIDGWFCDECD